MNKHAYTIVGGKLRENKRASLKKPVYNILARFFVGSADRPPINTTVFHEYLLTLIIVHYFAIFHQHLSQFLNYVQIQYKTNSMLCYFYHVTYFCTDSSSLVKVSQ